MRKQRAKGFTLLEVLIAALILFIVVGTITAIFSNSTQSRKRAEQHVLVNGLAPLLIEHVGEKVRQGNRSGASEFLGIAYQWTSKVAEQRPVVVSFSSESGEFSANDKQIVLNVVRLTLNESGFKQNFEFEVTTWK